MRRSLRIERFLEFLMIGVLMGTIEDLIAVKLATGASIDFSVILIIIAVSIPFAAFSELIVDRPEVNPWGFILDRYYSFTNENRN